VLYSFGSSPDGQSPWTGLTQGSNGNFYGVTYSGGANGLGTFFTVTPAGVETVLYSFGNSSSDAQQPTAAVIQGTDGNFYGTTATGGANGDGSVFMITPAGVETVLYSFGSNTNDGTTPYASLVQGTDGNFYGVTSAGGAGSAGTVFMVTPAGAETVLYAFNPNLSDGTQPAAALIQAADGNFYGTTPAGGNNEAGAVYQVTPAGVETVIYSFGTVPGDGTSPYSALVQAANGMLYGNTYSGGAYSHGVVFTINYSGTESVIYSFGGTATDGSMPKDPLILGSDGNFYGTTTRGGTNTDGTVFSITPAGVETVLYSFGTPNNGLYPASSLIQGANGSFYGTTISGGTNGNGAIFTLIP
jgi:uncharacterized repeat protein (TIGR03803 family)